MPIKFKHIDLNILNDINFTFKKYEILVKK